MPSADHEHMIGHDNAVPAVPCGDGMERALLAFCGAQSTIAAVADEDAGAGLARLRPEEDRVSGEPGCLNPPHGEGGRADETMTVVHAQCHRDVLPMVAKQVSGELGCGRRIVNPAWQVQGCLRDSVRVAWTTAPVHPNLLASP